MIIPEYARELAKIKTRLSRYSHISTFKAALNYLNSKTGSNPLWKRPWIVMFLLKQALLQKDGSEVMSERDFMRLVTRAGNLEDSLFGRNSEGSFMLMLRAMLAQQLWYQIPTTSSLRYLLLHREILNRSYESNNRLFQRKTGLELNDYYKIALYLLSQAVKESPNGVIRYSMSALYSHLSPALSDDTIVKFLKLVGLPFEQLAGYMKRFVVTDSNAAELYQETPFKNKPIIVLEDGLIIFNAGLCVLGLRSIVIEILRSDGAFANRFGNDTEAYIGERLRMTAATVYSMPDLNKVIPIKVGKIADYVVVGDDQIIVLESKSIIPGVMVKCVFDSGHLTGMLRDKFIYGVEQGQETAHKLAGVEKFAKASVRIVVVTLDEFFIYGGDYIAEHLDKGLVDSIASKYGRLPVPMSKVVFMTLRDLIVVTEWLRDKPANAIFEFFDELDRKQLEAGGMRFSVSQHIDEQIAAQVIGPVGMEGALDQSEEEMNSLLQQNSALRRTQGVRDYIFAFEQFKRRLIMAFQ